MAAARRGSLPYVFVDGLLAFILVGIFWGLFQTGVVAEITALPAWMEGSLQAQNSQDWILTAWDWLPLVVLIGIGIHAIVASRLVTSPSGSVAVRSFSLIVFHLVMLIWAYVFPEVLDPIFNIARDTQIIADALNGLGWMWIVDFSESVVYGYVPIGLIFAGDAFYIWAPIRDDVWGARY
jgi:hypothetical protein